MRDRLDEILAFHTGKSKEEIHLDTERDKILEAPRSGRVRLGRPGACNAAGCPVAALVIIASVSSPARTDGGGWR